MPRATGLPLAAAGLVAVVLLSIGVGAKGLPLGDVVDGLLHDDGSESAAIVRELRVPRTLIGLAVGLVLAVALARPLNALALGDDSGRALGAHVGRTRALGALAITLLCGGATAVAGPIVFVGLTIPHVARAIVGPDQRWLLPYSALLGPVLLLAAD